MSLIIQWIAVVAIFMLVGAGVVAILRYIRNRNKSKEDAEIVKAVKDATDAIVASIKEER